MLKLNNVIVLLFLGFSPKSNDAFQIAPQTHRHQRGITTRTLTSSTYTKSGISACRASKEDEQANLANFVLNGKKEEDSSSCQPTRRNWIKETTRTAIGGTIASSAALASRPSPVFAIDTLSDSATIVAETSCLCDPSVSTFRNIAKNRIVHILGTAHISADSAQLAGKLVREIKPKAVFVELDQKRVKRAVSPSSSSSSPPAEGDSSSSNGDSNNNPSETTTATNTNVQNTSADGEEKSPLLDNNPNVQQPDQPMLKKVSPFNLKEKAMRASSQLVGDAIKGLYKKLESDGFNAGEEFVIAVREGLAVNSKIILGDQDVEVTLRRLTEALSKTDLKKLLAADSEMEQNLKGILPENYTSNASDGMSKEEFKNFVETVKAKENVRLLMGNLKEAAPEVYNAMVGERDRFMGNGLNTLDQFQSIVAVMGIAHVDGVEQYLRDNGWEEVPATSCSPVRP